MTIRQKLHQIVFGTDTKAGKRFDVVLLWVILFSVLVVIIESVPTVGKVYPLTFKYTEWVLTAIFTLEFLLRLWISPKPLKYVFSFWGIIDFLSILPTYLSFFLTGYHYLLIVRIFRLLRVFRIFKLARFNKESIALILALKASLYKVSIFFVALLAIVTFMGTFMYVIEGEDGGFSSIPQSIYWAIVTVTTVGYGDAVPHSVLGKIFSSFAMIVGYAIIAVPTGIVTAEIARQRPEQQACKTCRTDNGLDANYCKKCGAELLSE